MPIFDNGFTAEDAVIGCIVVDEQALQYAEEQLTQGSFANPDAGTAFVEITAKHAAQGFFGVEDALCLKNFQYVANCLKFIREYGELKGARKWVDKVKEAAFVRQSAILGMKLAEVGNTREDILSLTAQLNDLAQDGNGESAIEDAAAVAGKWLIAQNTKRDDQIRTGLQCLDDRLHLQKGQLVYIGGRPSAGKTALGLQFMVQMARAGYRVVFFSLETDSTSLFDKLASNYGHIPLTDLVYKRREPQDPELARAADELSRLPVWLVNAAGKSIAWMNAVAASKRADVMIIDYVQLVPCRGNGRYEQITRISLDLHTAAQTSGRLIIGLAQMNREADGNSPTLRGLKESGQLEQDADAVILLADDKANRQYYFMLAKNKRGIVGRLHVTFDGEYQTFYEVLDL